MLIKLIKLPKFDFGLSSAAMCGRVENYIRVLRVIEDHDNIWLIYAPSAFEQRQGAQEPRNQKWMKNICLWGCCRSTRVPCRGEPGWPGACPASGALATAGQSFSSSSHQACTPNGANSAFLPMRAMKDLHFDTEKDFPKKYLKRGMHALFGQEEWPKIGYQIGKLIALHSCGWLAAEHLEVGATANCGGSLSLGAPASKVGLLRPPFLILALARRVPNEVVTIAKTEAV
ncbi:Hypothetical predicted protein [Cloeon dipterum]|uniref:Uncharacterized protein n=1 Tax=Cloeon dipterum TaxID=197152 RepID=A0A8S1CRA4_9INSE|nr:Hypothetical predicted protein [Cloeon dipterum]